MHSSFVIQFKDLIYCFIFCELECRIYGNKNVTRKTPIGRIHSSTGYSFPEINSVFNKFTLWHCCLFLGSSFIAEQTMSKNIAFRVQYISYIYEYMQTYGHPQTHKFTTWWDKFVSGLVFAQISYTHFPNSPFRILSMAVIFISTVLCFRTRMTLKGYLVLSNYFLN